MSRFARNTRDTLGAIRELMRLGVTIQFEKENIDTSRLSSEQTAAIYAAFAQMESAGHSSNMRTSVRMRMEDGVFSMPYGYRLNGLEPEIVPEETEVVRRIFAAALRGQGHTEITKWLNETGVKRGHGRERWHRSMVGYILSNRFYTGDSEWQKTCTTDTVPFAQVRNHGQKSKYHVEDDHPGIISREDFRRVQELIAARREVVLSGFHALRFRSQGPPLLRALRLSPAQKGDKGNGLLGLQPPRRRKKCVSRSANSRAGPDCRPSAPA